MESDSILFSVFGLRGGWKEDRIERKADAIIVHASPKEGSLRCPCCQSPNVTREGVVHRELRHGAINGRPIQLSLSVQRVRCAKCKIVRQAELPFADPDVRYTRAFARYALEIVRIATAHDAAKHLNVDDKVIKGIEKKYLKARFGKIKLKRVRRIAIDEIYLGKKSKFLTLVLDLETGAVVYIGEGKGADALDDFWEKLKESGAKIQAVASDMSPAYTLAIAENIPKAVHVFDRFHAVKLMNEKLTVIRRQAFQSATEEEKAVLKGSRFIILKNPENLDTERDEQKQLDEVLRINRALTLGYYLKEKLRLLWEQKTKEKAEKLLDEWVKEARASGVTQLKTMAKTLETRKKGLLAWYDHPISTAAMEGTNNKIGAIQRRAYGYRDEEFFRLKIHAAHLANYKLIG